MRLPRAMWTVKGTLGIGACIELFLSVLHVMTWTSSCTVVYYKGIAGGFILLLHLSAVVGEVPPYLPLDLW